MSSSISDVSNPVIFDGRRARAPRCRTVLHSPREGLVAFYTEFSCKTKFRHVDAPACCLAEAV